MTTMTCPEGEDLSRAVSRGELGPLSEHVAGCEQCSSEWNGMQRVRALARDLPAPPVGGAAASRVRARVLEGARTDRRRTGRRKALLWTGFSLAAAAVVLFAVRERPPGGEAVPRYHATIVPGPGARFIRESAAPNERVRLEAGTIHVDVTPLGPGERFLVLAGDGQVEVRGTAFDVGVLDGHLESVRVNHGRVEVRGADAQVRLLSAGGAWKRVEPEVQPTGSATVPGPASEPALLAPSREPPRSLALPSSANAVADPLPSTAIEVAPAPLEKPSPVVSTPTPAPGAAPVSVPELRDHEAERRERRDERRERLNERRVR